MKTFVVLLRLLCSVVLFGIFTYAGAQTIISFDASPYNTMIMKIKNSKFSDKTDKLILIFDSTTFTCEFSEGGLVAFHATSIKSDSGKITSSYTYNFSDKSGKNNNLLIDTDKSINLHNDPEKEEPLSLEDWMLCPDEWSTNRKL